MSSAGIGLASPAILEEAGRIAKILGEGGSGALSTMIGGDVVFTPGQTDFGNAAELVDKALGTVLATRLDWSGDRKGMVVVVLPEAGAKTLVAHMMALMLGAPADPDGAKMDAEGLDAYTEAMGNFAGQGAQALRGALGGALKLAAAGTKLYDAASADPAEMIGPGAWLCHKGRIALAGRPPVALHLFMTVPVTGMELEAPPPAPVNLAASAESLGLDPENLAHAMKLKVPLIVVLARNRMRMEVIQEMVPGTIIEFRKQAGEILDVCAGHVKIAEAEVVTTNQHFGVQIRHMVDPRVKVEG
jgi:flagellar motor switch/type III secretory pathway protein FliN/chemotaxis protein CheY-P-specific phosphatase CheC